MNLREALDADLIGFDGYGNVTLPREAFEAVHAAARRFLALAETGPDYEAARRAFEREFPCHCGPAFTDRDLHASDCVFDESDSVVPIVDAAVPWLSDYTKEET